MAKKRIVCIGCGPTSLGATFHLNELIKSGKISADDIEVTVLEQYGGPGGLSGTIKDEKGFSWDLGGHVHGEPSKYECFRRMLDSLPCEWNMIRRAAKCDMRHIFSAEDIKAMNDDDPEHSTYVPYPVQLSVPLFPASVRQSCIDDIRATQQRNYDAKPKDFDEWTERVFGKKLKEIFVTPYNKKVWTVPLEEMNAHWVGERVATVDVERLAELSKKTREQLLKDDLGWGPNTFFRYQKNEGCVATWRLITEAHPSTWYKYNHKVVAINKDKKVVKALDTTNNKTVDFEYDFLLNSMPIDLLTNLIGIDKPKLQFSKVALIGIGLKKPRAKWADETTWSYFPDPDVPFYRVTFLSNYNDKMTPDHSKYWSLLLEVGMQPHEPEDDSEGLIKKCIKALTSSCVIDCDSQVCHTWYQMLPYGYPIPTVARDAELRKAHALLEPAGIFSRGRFGGWKYEVANMDHSFAQGYELVDRWFNAKPETVYQTGL